MWLFDSSQRQNFLSVKTVIGYPSTINRLRYDWQLTENFDRVRGSTLIRGYIWGWGSWCNIIVGVISNSKFIEDVIRVVWKWFPVTCLHYSNYYNYYCHFHLWLPDNFLPCRKHLEPRRHLSGSIETSAGRYFRFPSISVFLYALWRYSLLKIARLSVLSWWFQNIKYYLF